ncbi:MAG TPA: thiamine pyrophosphate-binding protein [Burkholderiales bacterium]
MIDNLPARSGGRILVDQLQVHGAETAFCVPGESYLDVLDAFYESRERMRLIVCRQEGGASFMAEAYGKLTGRPGICLVTRGPGATNASIGVHTAYQDSTPLILFIGQVGSDVVEREAFQEMDYRRMFGQMAKWVAQIDRADRIPEYVSHAFHTAVSGRPGPVVLSLPEDMLVSKAAVGDGQRYVRVKAYPGNADMDRLREMLGQANKPLVILGGGDWSTAACEELRAFVEVNNLPATCSFRRQDLFDNRHPNYCGDVGIGISPALAQRVRDADLILTIGARLGEMTSGGYTLFSIPRPRQHMIHVHPSSEELGRVYQADLMIQSGMQEFSAMAAKLAPVDSTRWRDWTHRAREDYLKNLQHGAMPGSLDLGEVMAYLRKRLPADAILTNGAGNYSGWVQRFYQYTGFRTQLAPTNGAMGYGVPSALAAKVVHPDRIVVSFSGDGCFMMNGQELATAMQYDLPVLFLVINNGMYGTIRMHQEREYPGRVHATALTNPDFVALAKAYGLHGELVDQTAQFESAFERALAAGKPALLELRIDPEAITTRTSLTAVREQAVKAGR